MTPKQAEQLIEIEEVRYKGNKVLNWVRDLDSMLLAAEAHVSEEQNENKHLKELNETLKAQYDMVVTANNNLSLQLDRKDKEMGDLLVTANNTLNQELGKRELEIGHLKQVLSHAQQREVNDSEYHDLTEEALTALIKYIARRS